MRTHDKAPAGTPPAGAARIPISAKGLHLLVEPVGHGPLAPAIRLQVLAGPRATSIGATLPAEQADALAQAILAAAREALAAGRAE